MANIENPRKEFNFSIQIVGIPLNPFLVQNIKMGDATINQTEHGDTNYDVKTAGRVKFDNVEVEKLSTTDGADNYIWDWFASAQDAIIGGGNVPTFYKRTVLINELAEDGTSILNTWVLTGAWVCKVNGKTHRRTGSDNLMEKFELSVDRWDKI